jgi:hypothetical protein
MLVEVQRAKRFYDQCNEVIEHIKAQVDSIFSGAVVDDKADGEFEQSIQSEHAKSAPAPILARASRGDMDDDIPF